MLKLTGVLRTIALTAKLIYLGASLLYATSIVYAEENTQSNSAKRCETFAATLVSIEGKVTWQASANSAWQDAKLNDQFCYGETIKVFSKRAALRLSNETLVRLNANTTIKLVPSGQSFWVELVEGATHFLSRTPKKFDVKIKEPFVNASIDGTEFAIRSVDGETKINVFEGKVTTQSSDDQAVLLASDEARLDQGSTQFNRASNIQLADAVSWTLNYPPILVTDLDANPQVEQKLKRGQYSEALDLINAQTSLTQNEKSLAAALSLYVGDINQAKRFLSANVDTALNQSLIALVDLIEGRKTEAEKKLAVLEQRFANDAAILLTRSYIEQANFNLTQAYQSAIAAAQASQNEGLVWARVGELALQIDKVKKAEQALEKAISFSPQSSRVISLSGFIFLKEGKIKDAQVAFKRASEINSSDPLAKFAYSLTLIQQGKLTEGREGIELAALLAPNESIYRSYMGKAYFDEYRFDLAEEQFKLARQFDPLDPTPDFYEAVQLQTQNRATEALDKVKESIAKNDNRAVYRSRMMLDSDEAARAASLADIYLDLGFTEQAVVEAGNSLAQTPNEYSAHRLMALALIENRRADSARANEILRAQLTQPATANPIRSILSERNLLVVDGTGPSQFGINEYNPLFNRNKHSVEVGGLIGGQGISSGDLYVAGKHNDFSYLAERYEYAIDGFRENDDLWYDISSVYLQYAPNQNLSFFTEAKERVEGRGDLTFKLLDDETPNNQRIDKETTSGRIGLRYSPNSNLEFLATSEYIEDEGATESRIVIVQNPIFTATLNTDIESDDKAVSSSIAANVFLEKVKVLTGANSASLERIRSRTTQTVGFPGPPRQPNITPSSTDIKLDEFYLYALTEITENIGLTVGGKYVDVRDDIAADETFNTPLAKAALNFNFPPYANLTLAHYENFNVPNEIERSLEPTHLYSVLQQFDDQYGSKSKNNAIKFSSSLKGINAILGFTDREIEILATQEDARELDLEEQQAVANVNMTIKNFSLSLTYQYESFEFDKIIRTDPTILKTKQIPLEVQYHGANWPLLKLSYSLVNQEAYFDIGEDEVSERIKQDTDFGVLDASARLIKIDKRNNNIEIGIDLRNLTDRKFLFNNTQFQDGSPKPTQYYPRRTAFLTTKIKF